MQVNRILILMLVAILLLGSVAIAQDDTIVLEMWTGSSSPAEDEALEAQIAAFEAEFENIDVELLISPDYGTQIQSALASGDYPDVFRVDWDRFPVWVQDGVLMPAEGRIVDEEDIYPGLREAFSQDGELYCPAKDFSLLALVYNEDHFNEAGLDYPNSDWTWDDLYAAAEALTTEEHTGFSVAADRNRFLAFYYANGGSLFDDEGNVVADSDAAIEALEYYVSFVDNSIGDTPGNLGAGWNGEALGRGLASMTIEGNWMIGYLNSDFPELNWGVAEIPMAPTGDRATLTFTVCWGVSSRIADDPARTEAAWELVNFLTGPEGAEFVGTGGFGPLPARASAADLWLESFGAEMEPFVAGGEYAIAPLFPPEYADFVAALDTAIVDSINGDELPEDALTAAADVAREIQEELSE